MPTPMFDPTWSLTYDYFDPKEKKTRETLCSLGNGYMGVRGASLGAEATSEIHSPATFVAGLFNKREEQLLDDTLIHEDAVNCPNAFFLTFKIDEGDWLCVEAADFLEYQQTLDMQEGVLKLNCRIKDKKGRITKVETERFVHMTEYHLAGFQYKITPENYDGTITIKTQIDGSVMNLGILHQPFSCKHWEAITPLIEDKICAISAQTTESKIKIAVAEKVTFHHQNKLFFPGFQDIREEEKVGRTYPFQVEQGKTYTVEKLIAIYTSKDKGIKDPLTESQKSLQKNSDFSTLLKSHKKAWANLWHKFDIQIQGDNFSQLALRFHTFHLIQTASPNNADIDAGLPARGLSGEGYQGHIFWDEVYVMNFYTLHCPTTAKSLLLYRYNRLPRARERAEKNGYEGAMFPWQSGSTGEEVTPTMNYNPLSKGWDPDHSIHQRHVGFAIAYNVWNYWRKTEDLEFWESAGEELFFAIAQFAGSLAQFDKKDGRYHTYGIMGPDEFHEKLPGHDEFGFKDNAYSNIMIVWILRKVIEHLDSLSELDKKSTLQKHKIDDKTLKKWEEITHKMNLVIEDDIIEQFDGYQDLKELNWDLYNSTYKHIERLDRILKSEGSSPDEYQITKQADMLMIFYLLPEKEITDILVNLGYGCCHEMLEKNYHYYETRTTHGSTLSRIVHCHIAHALGYHNEAWKWYEGTLRSDIYDTQIGTTAEGIHVGMMGASIDMIYRGFCGVHFEDDQITVSACLLPQHWERLEFRLLYRKVWYHFLFEEHTVEITPEKVEDGGKILPVEINNKACMIPLEKRRKFKETLQN